MYWSQHRSYSSQSNENAFQIGQTWHTQPWWSCETLLRLGPSLRDRVYQGTGTLGWSWILSNQNSPIALVLTFQLVSNDRRGSTHHKAFLSSAVAQTWRHSDKNDAMKCVCSRWISAGDAELAFVSKQCVISVNSLASFQHCCVSDWHGLRVWVARKGIKDLPALLCAFVHLTNKCK